MLFFLLAFCTNSHFYGFIIIIPTSFFKSIVKPNTPQICIVLLFTDWQISQTHYLPYWMHTSTILSLSGIINRNVSKITSHLVSNWQYRIFYRMIHLTTWFSFWNGKITSILAIAFRITHIIIIIIILFLIITF